MPGEKFLSQITPSFSPPALTDQLVGVAGGTTDTLFTMQQLASTVSSTVPGRIKLQGETNFYVSTTGNNSNNGLSPGLPFATLQHADDVISRQYDLNGFDATVNIAPGSYVGVENLIGYFTSTGTVNPSNVTCFVTYSGDQVTPSNVKILPTSKRQIGFGQFAPNTGALTEVFLQGLDFVETVDSGVWYDNFYVGNPALGSVGVANIQFDGCGSFVPLMSGNIGVFGNVFLNGSASGWSVPGNQCTAIMNDGNESATGAIMFFQGTITCSGNPNVTRGVDQFLTSECLGANGGNITGSYVGIPFRVARHSLFFNAGQDWTGGDFGTPTGKPVLESGGVYNKFENQGYEATGGFIIGINKNYSQPATGFTLNLGLYDGIVIIDPAGTLATGTIVMSTPVIDQTRVSIRSSQAITSLTISAGGSETIKSAPTSLAAGQVLDAIYQDSNTTWYF